MYLFGFGIMQARGLEDMEDMDEHSLSSVGSCNHFILYLDRAVEILGRRRHHLYIHLFTDCGDTIWAVLACQEPL